MGTSLSTLKRSALVERDLATIWHPFTQAEGARSPLPLARAEGAFLYTEEGEAYLDSSSSWWTMLHGHAEPHIAAAIASQAETLPHAIFAGTTHRPAVQLAERLLEIAPGKMERVFYSDNGSTAVETALKLVIQEQVNRGERISTPAFVALRGGYHGETFGAMALSEPSLFATPFASHLFDVCFIDPPVAGREEASLAQLRKVLDQHSIIGFFFEPLIQGSGGMVTHSAEGLSALLALCQERGVWTIADEVFTGFGRTGTLFASDQLTSPPDILCLAKSLTAGFLPLGATLCPQRLYEAFLDEEVGKAFLAGHSYAGNPLGCVAAATSIELLLQEESNQARRRIEAAHREFVSRIEKPPCLKRAEVMGTLLILEYEVEQGGYRSHFSQKIIKHFLDRAILARPLGNVLPFVPPYCIKEGELSQFYAAVEETFLWFN